MFFDNSGTINIDGWQEVELLISKNLLVPLVVLDDCLMQELEAKEKRDLHREELTGMSCTCDQYGIACIVYFGHLARGFGDVKVIGLRLLFFLFSWFLLFLLHWLLLLFLRWLFL